MCVSGETKFDQHWSPGKPHLTVAEMYRVANDREAVNTLEEKRLRRAYATRGFGRTRSLAEDGTFVLNEILNIWHRGQDMVYKVTTETGRTISCNSAHRFPTPNGTKRLGEMSIADLLFVRGKPGKDDPKLSPLRAETERIVSIKRVGMEDVYDVEMAAPCHNFVTSTGIVTSNSHAAAYSVVAYQTAYLKAHYPVEFAAGLIEKEDVVKRPQVLENVVREGYDVLGPDANRSEGGFSVERASGEPQIRFGLGSIKDVGAEGDRVVAVREAGGLFSGVYDLAYRATPRLNAFRALVQAGALDSLQDADYPNRATMFEAAKPLLAYVRQMKSYESGRRKSLPHLFVPEIRADWPVTMRLFQEKEVAGAFVSGHPMDPYREFLQAVDRRPTDGLSNRSYRYFTGVVTEVKTRRTKTGKPMYYLTLSTGSQEHELSMFSDAYERYGAFVGPERALFVVGRDGSGAYQGKFSAEVVMPVEDAVTEWTLCAHVSVETPERAEAVASFADTLPAGDTQVWTTCAERTYKLSRTVEVSAETLRQMRAFGEVSCAV